MKYLNGTIGLATFVASLTLSSATAQEAAPIMGEPFEGMSPAELTRFEDGKIQFERIFSSAEGLGPIFNDNACSACHSAPLSGGHASTAVTRFGMAGPPFDPLANLGGSLQQLQAIDVQCLEIVPPSATVVIHRITPHTFGSGLVEAIADADIESWEFTPPSGNVSGKAQNVQPLEGGPMKVGRFGWKGGVATLLTFSGDAGLNEMGITNDLVMTENAPNGNLVLLAACDPTPVEPEDSAPIGSRIIDRWTDFQRFLAPPPQFPSQGSMTGETVFSNIGCAECHRQTYTSGVVAESFLSNQTFHPYSDFLLHDMGALGDGIEDGEASITEMKTAPLWGLAFREAMLHDGRVQGGSFATQIDLVIQEHDGEGAFSRTAYNALAQPDKDALVDFLQSLGRSRFDAEADNDRDEFDWFFLQFNGAFTGPGNFFTADDVGTALAPEGARADSDEDGDFDLADWGRFQRSYTGQIF